MTSVGITSDGMTSVGITSAGMTSVGITHLHGALVAVITMAVTIMLFQ